MGGNQSCRRSAYRAAGGVLLEYLERRIWSGLRVAMVMRLAEVRSQILVGQKRTSVPFEKIRLCLSLDYISCPINSRWASRVLVILRRGRAVKIYGCDADGRTRTVGSGAGVRILVYK